MKKLLKFNSIPALWDLDTLCVSLKHISYLKLLDKLIISDNILVSIIF